MFSALPLGKWPAHLTHITHLTLPPAGGQVGVAQLRVLPQVAPHAALALTLLALTPSLVSVWRRPAAERFAGAVAFAGLCGFWLGYHVHEKAVLAVRAVPLRF